MKKSSSNNRDGLLIKDLARLPNPADQLRVALAATGFFDDGRIEYTVQRVMHLRTKWPYNSLPKAEL